MIDIHTHVLPNVDDGSSSLEDSILLIKKEIENGVDTIIATPHHMIGKYEASVNKIKESYNLLLDEIKRQDLNVELLLGQEIYYSEEENIIELLNKKELLTLNNSKMVLLEFSFVHKPHELGDIIYNFNNNGYKVIIAHVERYEWMDIDLLKELKYEGALIQVNANSLINESEKTDCKFARKLLRKNLIDIVASDTHIFRTPNLKKVLKKVKRTDLFDLDIL